MNDLKLEHILNCHPIVRTDIVRGENTSLFCEDGKKIVDFEAGEWCTALGHSNERINSVMIEQANKIMNIHYKLTNHKTETLAVNLLRYVQFEDGKAVFLCSGSEAVEFSIRISKLVAKGRKVLTFATSYISAFSTIPRDKNIWEEIDFLKCKNCINKECTSQCSRLENINFSDISTFVLESATCGMVSFPPYKLVRFLANEVKSYGGLVVANEVTTGLGRLGKWFGYNYYDIEPDIVAMGKMLGNGYPISAVVMKREVANTVESMNFRYAQSHQNDPLGCAIANEVINILKEDNMIEISKEIGDFFLDQLREVKSTCAVVKEVRGRGLMVGLELNVNNITEIIAESMLTEGYFIGTTPNINMLRFFPSLTISKEDIIKMCKTLKAVLKEIEINYKE